MKNREWVPSWTTIQFDPLCCLFIFQPIWFSIFLHLLWLKGNEKWSVQFCLKGITPKSLSSFNRSFQVLVFFFQKLSIAWKERMKIEVQYDLIRDFSPILAVSSLFKMMVSERFFFSKLVCLLKRRRWKLKLVYRLKQGRWKRFGMVLIGTSNWSILTAVEIVPPHSIVRSKFSSYSFPCNWVSGNALFFSFVEGGRLFF